MGLDVEVQHAGVVQREMLDVTYLLIHTTGGVGGTDYRYGTDQQQGGQRRWWGSIG